jgi:tetratricopeptide (TPR) repeat protein
MSDMLPREVPEGLTPAQYYELGVSYRELGWTEQARDALTQAIEGDPEGDVGARARQFLQTKIPRHPVPLYAEQKNIEAFNLTARGYEAEAIETYELLIEEYPDFEWPYGNLGALFTKRGRPDLARKLLEKAVVINPYYVNGWVHLARARALLGDTEGARQCVKRILEVDPECQAALELKRLLG